MRLRRTFPILGGVEGPSRLLGRDGRVSIINMAGARKRTSLQQAEALVDDDYITLAGLLVETANGLELRIDDNLRREVDLPVTTFEVLIRLIRSPNESVRLIDLGRELAITTGGVTRLIDRLEAQKYVKRAREGSDRRAVYAKLTATGRRAVLRALPGHVADLEDAFSVLSAEQRAQFEEALRIVRDVVCYRTANPWLKRARQAARRS